MSVIAQFKDICVFPTTVFVFESYLKGDTAYPFYMLS